VKKILILIILLLSSTCAFADSVNIKTQVDKPKITIGERITYEIILEYDKAVEIEPVRLGENLGEFEIKDYHIQEPAKTKDNRLISRYTYIITTFTTGDFTIPVVKLKYKDVDGKEKEISSEELKITVESVKPKPSNKDDIRPLKGPAEIKGRFPIGLVIILVLLFISAAAVFIYLRNKKKIKEKPVIPQRPPEEFAREALKALLEMKLVEKGFIKEYYIRLSDILRTYIEGRYRIFALDRTTWELYQEMRSKKIERMHVDKINDFLEDCDLVKFAKYIPNSKEIEEVYKRAEEIIEITKSEAQNPKHEMVRLRSPSFEPS